ncbi:hypothetical protein SOL79_06840 [Streptococcus sp. VEG1o]|uniref:hypothetical protein n=1 Tax=Streptococcus sp. VEG1o TaxID=3097368 RepID=UPI0037ED81AA|nr:hypothetical protein [Streptococcus sp. O1]
MTIKGFSKWQGLVLGNTELNPYNNYFYNFRGVEQSGAQPHPVLSNKVLIAGDTTTAEVAF